MSLEYWFMFPIAMLAVALTILFILASGLTFAQAIFQFSGNGA